METRITGQYDWPRVIKQGMNGGFVEVDEIISLKGYMRIYFLHK